MRDDEKILKLTAALRKIADRDAFPGPGGLAAAFCTSKRDAQNVLKEINEGEAESSH
jgi:hypothetical protein